MRKKSLETLSETKKRNNSVGDEIPAKKTKYRVRNLEIDS